MKNIYTIILAIILIGNIQNVIAQNGNLINNSGFETSKKNPDNSCQNSFG